MGRQHGSALMALAAARASAAVGAPGGNDGGPDGGASGGGCLGGDPAASLEGRKVSFRHQSPLMVHSLGRASGSKGFGRQKR
jgi:hypothetical protein